MTVVSYNRLRREKRRYPRHIRNIRPEGGEATTPQYIYTSHRGQRRKEFFDGTAFRLSHPTTPPPYFTPAMNRKNRASSIRQSSPKTDVKSAVRSAAV